MRTLNTNLLALVAAATMTFTGCNKEGGEKAAEGAAKAGKAAVTAGKAAAAAVKAPAFMELIPADTPYVFANTQPIPNEVMAKLFTAFEPITKKIDEELAKELAKPATDSADDKMARAVAEELKGNLSLEGFKKLGFKTDTRFALYGVGVLPVVRFELGDVKAFKAMIERIETKGGQKAPTAKQGDQEYWKISEDGVTVAIAIVGSDLVVTGGPDAAMGKLLPMAFGQTKPAKSIASTGVLAKINSKYGFANYGTGMIDLNVVAGTLMGDVTGLNQEIFASLGAGMPPLDATCKGEIKGMVAKAPRMVFGYTKMDAKAFNAKYVLELDGALAGDMAGLAAPVPGHGIPVADALMSFGVGLDVGKAMAFAKKTVANLKANPFKCAMLADLNQGVAGAEMGLNNPLPPFVNDIRGAYVVLKSGDFMGGAPKNVKGYAVIAANNADQLFGMLKGMAPPLASLTVNADSKAVALPAGLVPPVVEAPHIAMSKSAIAVSVGAGEEKNLSGALSAKSGNPAPLFSFDYNVGAFLKMVEGQPGMGADEKALIGAVGGMMGNTGYAVTFTKHGVEMAQTVTLK